MLTGAFLCLPFTNAPGKQPQAPAAIVLNALCYASYLSASMQLLCIISAFITLNPIPSTIISARSTSAVNPLTVVVTIKNPSLTARSCGTRNRISSTRWICFLHQRKPLVITRRDSAPPSWYSIFMQISPPGNVPDKMPVPFASSRCSGTPYR